MSDEADSPADWIENRTYDEIAVGDAATLMRTLSQADLELFAAVSGETIAGEEGPRPRAGLAHPLMAHGMWGGSLIAALLSRTFYVTLQHETGADPCASFGGLGV